MQKLLNDIQDIYEIGSGLEYVEDIKEGYLAENYVIRSNKEKYFLKKYREEEGIDLENVHIAKFFFFQKGIPIILPFTNRYGKTRFEYEGSTYALFPFVKGRSVSNVDIINEDIESMGTMLANIHLAGKEYPKDVSFRTKNFWNDEKFFKEYGSISSRLSTIQKKNEYDELTLELLELKKNIIEKNVYSEECLF